MVTNGSGSSDVKLTTHLVQWTGQGKLPELLKGVSRGQLENLPKARYNTDLALPQNVGSATLCLLNSSVVLFFFSPPKHILLLF